MAFPSLAKVVMVLVALASFLVVKASDVIYSFNEASTYFLVLFALEISF